MITYVPAILLIYHEAEFSPKDLHQQKTHKTFERITVIQNSYEFLHFTESFSNFQQR